MKITIKIIYLILLLLIGKIALADSSVLISDIRFSNESTKCRIVFDLSGLAQYHVTQSSNPERVFIDIDNARSNKPINKSQFKNTPVENISSRSAQNKKDWRFTLELKKKVEAKAFVLNSDSAHPRLVVDLTPPAKTTKVTSSKSPAKTAAKPVLVELSPPVIKSTFLQQPNNEVNSVPVELLNSTVDIPPQPVIKSPVKKNGSRNIIIVLDPGHGGKDPGATGNAKNKEKDVVLAISRRLQTIINQEPGFKAVMTRNSDNFISLRQRLDIARNYKADMFVAIHADAFKNLEASGASVFALSERGATSEAARWLAEKENQSEMIGVGDLSDKDQLLRSVLIDLSQTHTISVSLQIGNSVLQELSKMTRLHHARVEQAAFVVLKSPDIPSLLIETGYISNPRQEQQLISPAYQQQIASSILRGIKSYFMRHPPQGTLL